MHRREVGVDYVAPVLVGEVLGFIRAAVRAGVVDDDVPSAESGRCLIQSGLDGCAVGDVAGEGQDVRGFAAGGLGEGFDSGGELVGVAGGDGYVGAVFDEALGDAESDAAVTAGYEGGFVGEVEGGVV